VTEFHFGLRANAGQVAHQLVQVLLVGFAIGMMRTVVPALAEREFGVEKGSFLALTSFVVAFGLVKAVLNFVAGRLSERLGRRPVLLIGWIAAIPIPIMIWLAPNWGWIVAATVLLGVNQGLCWSMTQTAKLDITNAGERGLTLGLNEFSGYVGVALAGVLTAYAAGFAGPREGILIFGLGVVALALVLVLSGVRETLPWAQAEAAAHGGGPGAAARPRYPSGVPANPTAWQVFALMSWRDRRLAAVCQAGLVEKFTDALVWVMFPAFLFGRGVALTDIGWITGAYGFVWGGAQLFTGRLSDRIGRHWPNVAGMWICGAGVAMAALGAGAAWWMLSAAVTGFGMALLYPNLSAAVADITPPAWRGSAIGIYRFWRDFGYAAGALGLGLTAHLTGAATAAFWFVALAMFVSGAVLWLWGEETHPRINPAKG
jgi:MFS family permease